MSRLGALRQLTWARVILFLREPEAIFWVVLFPVVLALVLSIAFKDRAVGPARIGIVEGSIAPAAEATLEGAPGIELVRFADREAAERKLRSGALAALVLPGEPLAVRYDPSRAESELARLRVEDAIRRRHAGAAPVEIATERVTEHGSRYIDFLIPGLLGMNLMGTGIWGTGFAIVDWRQKKLLKRFLVTPMSRTSFLFAQILSRFVFLVLEVTVIALFGVLALGVPFHGSLAAFALVCILGALCFSGMGLLVASRSQTVEGVSGLMNFVMMPMWLFSGVFFSYENFPRVFLPFIRLLPLTALNDALRALMLEGDRLHALLPETGVLLVWTVLGFLLALRVFRWQ
jgi:ABC-2 type transport system permease protein